MKYNISKYCPLTVDNANKPVERYNTFVLHSGTLFIQGFVPTCYTIAALFIVLYYSLVHRVLREYNIDEIRTGMSLVPGNRYKTRTKTYNNKKKKEK